MQTLSSYVLGSWKEASGDLSTLVNPTNEEAIATCGTDGIDMQAVLRYGREIGGPALRALTFAERGGLLKSLSKAIHEQREELIELSIQCSGTTRGDAKFDLDGGTGTLSSYAFFAKSLPDKRFLPDGEGTQLGRTARFWGEHISVPREGVAIHINAFNFPVWNMCEKMACALLAGVPVVEKPGTATSYLAWRTAQIIVESGVLPEGAFQFLCGSAGDLLSHAGAQDVLAFTGGSRTAALLRGHENLVRHNVHVNAEADSLNAAVLAPDVDSDSETYGLFLSNVQTDMTQKAGQKCTAVRRIFVPADRVDEVVEDLLGSLARIKVGDPSERDNRMGPLASASALKSVREGIDALG
ncbi:MAG: 3,4-dehydroadipyl-CoA semialdehyde dehydrogenase, partial [Planctomycetota bacterium]